MCDRDPRDKGLWCPRHQAAIIRAQLKAEARPRSHATQHHPNIIIEVQALYDWSLSATTVRFLWVPTAWWRKPSNFYARNKLIPRTHDFSLTEKTRLSNSVHNGWWQPIRRWITREADVQGYGFTRSCKWTQVNAPNTAEHALSRSFTDKELRAMEKGTYDPLPFHGILDLRFSCTKPIHPYWREPCTDFTPVKFREEVVCETCHKTMGDVSHEKTCPGLTTFRQAKETWHTWYVQHMGREPIVVAPEWEPNIAPSWSVGAVSR